MPATEEPPRARNFNRIHRIFAHNQWIFRALNLQKNVDHSKRNRLRCSGPSSAPSGLLNKENVPCEPRKSGVDIAESIRPLKSSGGNVTWTRRIVLPTPCRSRIFQKRLAFAAHLHRRPAEFHICRFAKRDARGEPSPRKAQARTTATRDSNNRRCCAWPDSTTPRAIARGELSGAFDTIPAHAIATGSVISFRPSIFR